MRQAGRYLPGYRKVREKADFLTMCRRPDLAAEVSLEPVERFGVDAAIVFSDILIPLEAMGLRVEFDDHGPRIVEPVRDAAAVGRLRAFEPREKTPWILETLERLAAALPKETPPVGFSGAPWTLAAYAIEGRTSKGLAAAKGLRWRDPATLRAFLDLLAETTVPYLAAQAEAGARALQVFDTHAGELSREDFETFEVPALRKVFDGVRAALGKACPPLVLYSQGTSAWLDLLPRTGADAFSVDWRLPLGDARRALGGRPVQGNLDPAALLGSEDELRAATRRMLASVAGGRGVVANLGHGVLVGTPPENVAAFVDEVKRA
jgi:uroporphyrinogen decarboxylase